MNQYLGSWRALLGSVMVAVFALVAPTDYGGVAILVWSVGCSVVIFASLPKDKNETRTTIQTLGWTAALTSLGFVVRGIHGEIVGQEAPIPSPADIIHIPAYLLFFYTVFRVHRARANGRSPDAWLDALVIAVALFIALWIVFLGDFVLNSDIDVSTRFVNSIYTTIILVTFTVFLRVSSTPGIRPPSYYLLGGAAFSYFVVDLAATYSLVRGTGLSLTVSLSPFVYGLAVAAVRHDSSHLLLDRQKEREFRVGPMRLLIIGLAIAAPITSVLVEPNRSRASEAVLVISALFLTSIVVVRVVRLLGMQERASTIERALGREVATLASLGSTEEIRSQLTRAVSSVLPTLSETVLDKGDEDTSVSFELPALLRSMGEQFLSIQQSRLSYTERRVIETLVRDAGLLAASAEGVAASARHASEAAATRRIAANEQRFRALVQNASDIVSVISNDGTVTYVSEAVANVLGHRPEAFLDRSLEWVIHENDWDWAREHFQAVASGSSTSRHRELRAVHADGSVRLLECVFTDMRHVEGIHGMVINATDATAKRSLERDLRDAETTDLLTLQLNRTAFLDETETAIRRSSVSGSSVAVAIINVDQFRTVNESLGPAMADQVLIEVAQAIRRSVRMHDVVARLSGDEFGVLMPDSYSSIEAVHALERTIGEIASPITVGGHTLTLQATAGVVLDSDGSNTAVSLLRNADTALDVAKHNHRGKTVLFEESMGEAASERIELRNTLETAISNGQLRLVYQPLVDINTGEIASMEALSRWEHPTRGNISPGAFIPIAESAGLITELGEWALRTACNQVVEWEAKGMGGFTVSVNMSGHQLREENIINRVRHILDETKVAPKRITIEITESVLIDDTDFIAQRITALRELGLGLAIDDFGTGYSSLSYLTRYEFDVLKIDRSFVIPLADPALTREREIVKAMINLASSLGAVSVAEGIERPEELDMLAELGCNYGQGYLFWYPLELEQVAPAFAESRQLAA